MQVVFLLFSLHFHMAQVKLVVIVFAVRCHTVFRINLCYRSVVFIVGVISYKSFYLFSLENKRGFCRILFTSAEKFSFPQEIELATFGSDYEYEIK